jgi:hypothetical protein
MMWRLCLDDVGAGWGSSARNGASHPVIRMLDGSRRAANKLRQVKNCAALVKLSESLLQ